MYEGFKIYEHVIPSRGPPDDPSTVISNDMVYRVIMIFQECLKAFGDAMRWAGSEFEPENIGF